MVTTEDLSAADRPISIKQHIANSTTYNDPPQPLLGLIWTVMLVCMRP